jgi:hypothetical protein
MVHKKIVALIIVINHPSIQELFAAAGIKTSTASPTEELETTAMPDVDSPILPQVLFQERTSGDQKRSNRVWKKRNFWSVSTEPVEEECIQIYQNRRAKKEQYSSEKAAKMAKSRLVKNKTEKVQSYQDCNTQHGLSNGLHTGTT